MHCDEGSDGEHCWDLLFSAEESEKVLKKERFSGRENIFY